MAAPEGAAQDDVLRSIDVTLSALLAITLDDYVPYAQHRRSQGEVDRADAVRRRAVDGRYRDDAQQDAARGSGRRQAEVTPRIR